jgi:anti-anti-sigma factor
MNAILLERNLPVTESVPQVSLEFDVEDLGCVVVIRIRGEATCDQAADLDEYLRSSLTPGSSFVLLDLERVPVVGPQALQTLKEFARDVSHQGVEVWLTGLQALVWLALHTAGLGRFFTIRGSLSQALAS